MNELEGLSSIWDGWEKQCYGTRHDGGGKTCALGFLDDQFGDCYRRKLEAPIHRVAAYVRQNLPDAYDLQTHYHVHLPDDYGCVAQANNILRLTPEQFREIDRLTQYEEAQKQLSAQIDALPEFEALDPAQQQEVACG